MKWYFLNTGSGSGRYNMDFDLQLAKNNRGDEVFFRLYRWNPYCISLGFNQEFSSVNVNKASRDKIDIVKRPTGGKAILHSEELTYSVIYPIAGDMSLRNFYKESLSEICFTVSVKSEINFSAKKLVGSAQRKIGRTILQHGSILCGDYHTKIIDYLNLSGKEYSDAKTGMLKNTTGLKKILQNEVDYDKMSGCIIKGFEKFFNINFLNLDEEILILSA